MRFSLAAAAALISVASVRAADHPVLVGANGTLTFSPSELDNVASGDTISFQFQSKNHSVTQSSFANPCSPLDNGFNSGFMFVQPGAGNGPSIQISIANASAPMWFYCAQTSPVSHCGMGMVFAMNPTPSKTFAMFQSAAMALGSSNSTTPGNSTTTGGTINSTATGIASPTGTSPLPPVTNLTSTGTASPTGTSPSSPSTTGSSAMKLSSGAAGIMTIAALLLGVSL